ncbi:MAG TPA: nucleotidyltransferase domain-containing protein [Vicinamibacterales bacterium]|nr:nucleotidyltransferase domain-containing protein [Vicinamibacterales bacterium]
MVELEHIAWLPLYRAIIAAVTHVLERYRERLAALCRKYRVRRLDVFGSATRDDFDERASEIDLLIEFEDLSFGDRADAYLGFLTEAEALLQRRVDLVELRAVRNPYLREGIEASRELVYAA